ncbi:MAG: hypothetical protein ACR2FY_12850 [Pirellulaceae bacterium]
MKMLLNCDEVFEALTSGCDAAQKDEALCEHLECCAECRQLAEAAGPAVDLFGDALRSDERDHGSAAELASTVFARLESQQHAALANCHRRSFLSLSAHAWSQLGAAAAILLAVGGLFWAASPGELAGKADLVALPAFTSPLARGTEPTEHGLLHLASLQLPEACLVPVRASHDGAAKVACCTRCHQTGDLLPTVRLVAFSQQSCLACHKS